MGAQPGHDSVDVPVQDPGGVADALAIAELDVLLAERRSGPAKPRDPDFDGDPRPVRRPLEQHRYVAAGERPLGPAARLDLVRQVQNAPQLSGVEIANIQKIAAGKALHTRDHDPPAGAATNPG